MIHERTGSQVFDGTTAYKKIDALPVSLFRIGLEFENNNATAKIWIATVDPQGDDSRARLLNPSERRLYDINPHQGEFWARSDTASAVLTYTEKRSA